MYYHYMGRDEQIMMKKLAKANVDRAAKLIHKLEWIWDLTQIGPVIICGRLCFAYPPLGDAFILGLSPFADAVGFVLWSSVGLFWLAALVACWLVMEPY